MVNGSMFVVMIIDVKFLINDACTKRKLELISQHYLEVDTSKWPE